MEKQAPPLFLQKEEKGMAIIMINVLLLLLLLGCRDGRPPLLLFFLRGLGDGHTAFHLKRKRSIDGWPPVFLLVVGDGEIATALLIFRKTGVATSTLALLPSGYEEMIAPIFLILP